MKKNDNSTIKQDDSKNEKTTANKSTNLNNNSSKVNDDHKDPLYNPEIIAKRKVIINTSTSKAMYLFPKAERFHELKSDNSSFFYNLPSVANNRSTSIGFGNKTNFVPSINGRNTNMYDIPREFDLRSKYNGSPKYSFGYGRDVCRIPLAKDEKTTPAPNSYTPYKKFGAGGLHYSMSFRINRPNPNFNNPGPGAYTFIQLNTKGKYSTSLFPNSPLSKFPLAKRFKYNYNNNPGPGAYMDENLMKGNGVVYNSKFCTNLGKTMGKRLCNAGQKLITPGPGAYEYFSDFEGFGKYRFPKLKKSASTGNLPKK